jgi:hypothetical protein
LYLILLIQWHWYYWDNAFAFIKPGLLNLFDEVTEILPSAGPELLKDVIWSVGL